MPPSLLTPPHLVAGILCSVAPVAQAATRADEMRNYDLPSGDAAATLSQFAGASGRQILYMMDTVRGVQTNAVSGRFTPQEALSRMFAGTSLVATWDAESGAFVVSRKLPPPSAGAPRGERGTDLHSKPQAASKTMTPSRIANRVTAWIALLAAPMAQSQTAPAAPGQMAQTVPIPQFAPDEERVELSPFVVTSIRDVGYLAENTLAGSRLNSRLSDTPGSVSVFTKEFIEDLGITDLNDLLPYSVNSEIDRATRAAGSAENPFVNALNLNKGTVVTRGLLANQGLDFFTSITPSDVYRVSRYDDTRGPNSILFGVGPSGGILNQTSKTAVLYRNSLQLRHSTGSWGRNRVELDANRVLNRDKIAVGLAALHQENGGWRAWNFQDKDRIFGSVVVRPRRELTFNVMGETGREVGAAVRNSADSEEMLAWYDNRDARGMEAVTFVPSGANPTAAQRSLGIVARHGNPNNSRRITLVENNGTIFDAVGTLLSGTYNDATVRAPDGTPGVAGGVLRINDPALYPRHMNAAGPGMYRDHKLHNYTITADWQLTDRLHLNAGHNYQKIAADIYMMNGTNPPLRGDPNRTLGVGGPANPFAGMLYIDGEWRLDTRRRDYRETRLSVSYDLEVGAAWVGRHRLALMGSTVQEYDERVDKGMVLAGQPGANPLNENNRVTVRNYLTEGDHGTYRAGHWNRIPREITVGGTTYRTAWANSNSQSGNNAGANLDTDSMLAVAQSRFFGGRLVTTLGYREDRAKIEALGYRRDPDIGDVIDHDPAKSSVYRFTGRTETTGAVFHLGRGVSLIGNRSSTVGIPAFNRTLFPDGKLADPSRGEGKDFGLGFDLLGGRVSAKVVYFTSSEKGTTDEFSSNTVFTARNIRIMDALQSQLVGAGRPISAAEWEPIHSRYTPVVTGVTSDFLSEGYEARITANLLPNWRLVVNYSYTDAGRTNLYSEVLPWYGMRKEGGLIAPGVTQNASGQYVVNPVAFESGGAVAEWLQLASRHPSASLSSVTTSAGISVAQELFNLIDDMNSRIEAQERRWGLRPHKVSLFTTYDFKRGKLRGFSVGGGWRWRSANVIGANAAGKEITGKAIESTDLMLRYSPRPRRLPGKLTFQVNVTNLLNDTGIIPVRLSTSETARDGFVLPGGRGIAYSRYDLVEPREIRFTTTYSF
jgi:iron complex outermembrane recepter protein